MRAKYTVDSSGEPAVGACAVETKESACEAAVTHDFCALVVNPSPAAASFETGAQNCERARIPLETLE